MKHKLLFLTIFVMASITSRAQSMTPAPNKSEKRILVILDTLKNDYYWQSVPTDFMGRTPTIFDILAERRACPYRVERNNYLQELDSLLLDKDLSETFLIDLLDKEYRPQMDNFAYKVALRLYACQTDKAYAATYHFVAAHLGYYEIALKLIESDRYKDEIKNCILKTPIDDKTIDYLYPYLHVFDKETDKQLLDKAANYVKANLDKNPFASFLKAGVISGYYQMNREAFENEQTKAFRKQMEKLTASKEFDKARDNYWRAWAENVLQYYETHGVMDAK